MCVYLKTLANESDELPAYPVPRMRYTAPRLCERIRHLPYCTTSTLLFYAMPALSALSATRPGRPVPDPKAAGGAPAHAATPMPPPVPPWPWTTTWEHLLWAADAAASLQTLHADLTQNKSPCRRAARLRLPSPLSRPTHPPPPPRGAALQAPAPRPQGGVSIARSHVHGTVDGTAVCGASA